MTLQNKLEELKSYLDVDYETLTLDLENFIKEYTKKLDREGVMIGLSGGLDSAVVAALCERALGSDKVLALIMPEADSKKENVEDAISFARELNIEIKLIDITKYLKVIGAHKLFPLNKIPLSKGIKENIVKKSYKFFEKKDEETPFSTGLSGLSNAKFNSYIKKTNAYYRAKHRIRMVLLYLYGELENRLIVGAANKSEYKIGFFVKHGCDDAADIMPIINLYKTQVRGLAKYLQIPSKIIEKAPSPDILPGLTDEETIGLSYESLDLILLALEKGWQISEISDSLHIDNKKVEYVKNLIEKSEHMRKVYAP